MITAHYENQLMSSLLLTIDHHLLKKGTAFENSSSTFLTFLINTVICGLFLVLISL